MLEGIVEQNDIEFAVVLDEFFYSVTAVLVDGDGYVGEFLFHLVGLVANHPHGRIGVGNDEFLAFAFISTAQHCHFEGVLQHIDQILHMGCLACSANSDVANGDDGDLESARLQRPCLEQQVAQLDAQSVAPAQRQ